MTDSCAGEMPLPPRLAARRTLLPLAIVALVGVAAYSRSFDVPLQFDDLPSIVLAPEVHATELSLSQLGRATADFPLKRWLPKVTFAVNHALHGLRPLGYHVANLLIHLATAALVLAVARRLLEALGFSGEDDRRSAALIAALIFVSHPVNTQSVTYVVQRFTSLGAFFALVTVLCWLLARSRPEGTRWPLAVAGVASWYLAVSCKENYLVVPVLILFLEWLVEPRLGERLRTHWRLWLVAGTSLAAAAAFSLWWYADHIARESARFGVPVGRQLLTQGRILAHYLSLLALPLPSRLRVDYAWSVSTGLLSPPSTLLAPLGLIAVVALAFRYRKQTPLLLLAVGWFLIALSIEQSFLPLDLVFEQRLYFSAIGIFLAVGAAAVRWIRLPRVGAWAVTAPVVLLLAGGTFARNEQWRDPVRLYTSDGTEGPGAVRNLLNLGKVYQERGQYAEAERALRRAIEIAPARYEPPADLGNLALVRRDFPQAEQWYRTALALNPLVPNVWHNLGVALARQARTVEAQSAFERALALDPRQTRSRIQWALLTYQRGDRGRAMAAVDEAIAIDPGAPDALTLRSQMRFEARDYAGAERDARTASTLVPGMAAPREMIVRALAASGRLPEARQAAIELLRLAPGNDVAQRALGAPR